VTRKPSELRPWLALVTPPVAWFGAQQGGFLLSPWICRGGSRWALVPIFAVAALAMAVAAAAAWREHRVAADGERGALAMRRQFMAASALLLTALSLVALGALAVPAWLETPCG
jgi:hypothetical protein